MAENLPAEWTITNGECGGRDSSGDGASELLESSRRAWPHVVAHATKELAANVSAAERKSLAVEVWEGVLRSVSRTLDRRKKTKPIEDLEAYLIGAFHHRFNRILSRERKRKETVDLCPSIHHLASLKNARDEDWVANLDNELLVKEVLSRMDDWARKVWIERRYGYSWREIALHLGEREQQLKMRFRYSLEKTRRRIEESGSET